MNFKFYLTSIVEPW